MRIFLKRFVSLVAAAALSLPPSSYALPSTAASAQAPVIPLSASDLAIPEELGRIETLHEAGAGASWVFLIQDAHCVKDSEDNISALITYLEKKYGVRLIGLEGGSGPLDPTLLRAFPDRFVKSAVLRQYVESGELSGAELASISAEGEASFYGIEDWALYKENFLAYIRARREAGGLDLTFSRIENSLDRERRRLYSALHNEFHERVRRAQKDDGGFPELVRYISRFLKDGRVRIDLSVPEYTALKALFDRLEQETPANAERIDRMLRGMAGDFEKRFLTRLSGEDRAVFSGTKQEYLSGKTDAASFLAVLISLGRKVGLSPRLSPELRDLLQYHDLLQGGRGTIVFAQMQSLIIQIEDRLAESPEAGRVAAAFRKLGLLRDLSRLELTREGLDAYEKDSESVLELLGAERKHIEPALAYYDAALRRDQALKKNLAVLSGKAAGPVAAVAGGFHTRGLASLIGKEGVSYAVITPKIASLAGHERYDPVMSGEVSYARGGWKNPYDSFMKHASAQLAARLGEPEFGRTLKDWRDELIRRLADEKRISQVGKYTPYIDGLFELYQKKFGVAPAAGTGSRQEEIRKALEDYGAARIDSLWSEFETAFRERAERFRALAARGDFSQASVKAALFGNQPAGPSTLAAEVVKMIPGSESVHLYDIPENASPLPDVAASTSTYIAALNQIASGAGGDLKGDPEIIRMAEKIRQLGHLPADLRGADTAVVREHLMADVINRSELRENHEPEEIAGALSEALEAGEARTGAAENSETQAEVSDEVKAERRRRMVEYLDFANGRLKKDMNKQLEIQARKAGTTPNALLSTLFLRLRNRFPDEQSVWTTYEATADPKTYLYTVLNSIVLTEFRKKEADRHKLMTDLEGPDSSYQDTLADGEGMGPLLGAISAERAEIISRILPSAIKALKSEHQWYIQRHFLEGRSVREIYDELTGQGKKVTINSVNLTVLRATKALRAALEERLPQDMVEDLKSAPVTRKNKGVKKGPSRKAAPKVKEPAAVEPAPVRTAEKTEEIEPPELPPEALHSESVAGAGEGGTLNDLVMEIFAGDIAAPASAVDTAAVPIAPEKSGVPRKPRVKKAEVEQGGKRFQELRLLAGITNVTDAGSMLGGASPIPAGTIKNWEAGLNRVPQDIMERMQELAASRAPEAVRAMLDAYGGTAEEFAVYLPEKDEEAPDAWSAIAEGRYTEDASAVILYFRKAGEAFRKFSGQELKKLIKDYGITQSGLAEGLKISRPTLDRMLKDGMTPEQFTAARAYIQETVSRRLSQFRLRTGLDPVRFLQRTRLDRKYDAGQMLRWGVDTLPPPEFLPAAEKGAQRIEGEWLQGVRRFLGLVQIAFGELLTPEGAAQNTVSAWERGASPIPGNVRDAARTLYMEKIRSSFGRMREILGYTPEVLALEMSRAGKWNAEDIAAWEDGKDVIPEEALMEMDRLWTARAGVLFAKMAEVRTTGYMREILGVGEPLPAEVLRKWEDGTYPVPLYAVEMLRGLNKDAGDGEGVPAYVRAASGQKRSEIRGPGLSEADRAAMLGAALLERIERLTEDRAERAYLEDALVQIYAPLREEALGRLEGLRDRVSGPGDFQAAAQRTLNQYLPMSKNQLREAKRSDRNMRGDPLYEHASMEKIIARDRVLYQRMGRDAPAVRHVSGTDVIAVNTDALPSFSYDANPAREEVLKISLRIDLAEDSRFFLKNYTLLTIPGWLYRRAQASDYFRRVAENYLLWKVASFSNPHDQLLEPKVLYRMANNRFLRALYTISAPFALFVILIRQLRKREPPAEDARSRIPRPRRDPVAVSRYLVHSHLLPSSAVSLEEEKGGDFEAHLPALDAFFDDLKARLNPHYKGNGFDYFMRLPEEGWRTEPAVVRKAADTLESLRGAPDRTSALLRMIAANLLVEHALRTGDYSVLRSALEGYAGYSGDLKKNIGPILERIKPPAPIDSVFHPFYELHPYLEMFAREMVSEDPQHAVLKYSNLFLSQSVPFFLQKYYGIVTKFPRLPSSPSTEVFAVPVFDASVSTEELFRKDSRYSPERNYELIQKAKFVPVTSLTPEQLRPYFKDGVIPEWLRSSQGEDRRLESLPFEQLGENAKKWLILGYLLYTQWQNESRALDERAGKANAVQARQDERKTRENRNPDHFRRMLVHGIVLSNEQYAANIPVNIPALRGILRTGNYAAEAIGLKAGSHDSFPFNVDLSRLGEGKKEREIRTLGDLIEDSTSGGYGKLFLLYDPERLEKVSGGVYKTVKPFRSAEDHRLTFVSIPRAYLSGIVTAVEEAVYVDQIKREVAEGPFYVPVYNYAGDLLLTPEEYERMRLERAGLPDWKIPSRPRAVPVPFAQALRNPRDLSAAIASAGGTTLAGIWNEISVRRQHTGGLLGAHIEEAVGNVRNVPEFERLDPAEQEDALLALLFHDLGKPVGESYAEEDPEHALKSEAMAREILRENRLWGLDTSSVQTILLAVRLHSYATDHLIRNEAPAAVREGLLDLLPVRLSPEERERILRVLYVVNKADALVTAPRAWAEDADLGRKFDEVYAARSETRLRPSENGEAARAPALAAERGPRISDSRFQQFRNVRISEQSVIFTARFGDRPVYIKTGPAPLIRREINLMHRLEQNAELRPYLPEVISAHAADDNDSYALAPYMEDGGVYFVTAEAAGQNYAVPPDSMEHAARRINLLAGFIAAAHENGLAHGDLKPHEVIEDPKSGQLTILDYGVSVLRGSDEFGEKSVGEISLKNGSADSLSNTFAGFFSNRFIRDFRALIAIIQYQGYLSGRLQEFDRYFAGRGIDLENWVQTLDGYYSQGPDGLVTEDQAALDDFYDRNFPRLIEAVKAFDGAAAARSEARTAPVDGDANAPSPDDPAEKKAQVERAMAFDVRGPRISQAGLTNMLLLKTSRYGFTFKAVREGKTVYVKTGRPELLAREIALIETLEKNDAVRPYLPKLVSAHKADEKDAEYFEGRILPGTSYFITEDAEGVELSKVDGNHPLEYGLAVRLKLLAEAVETFHRSGLSHGDLKPEDVLSRLNIPDPSSLVILDYGIAALEGSPEFGTESLDAIDFKTAKASELSNPYAHYFTNRRARDFLALMKITDMLMKLYGHNRAFTKYFMERGIRLDTWIAVLENQWIKTQKGVRENRQLIDAIYGERFSSFVDAVRDIHDEIRNKNQRLTTGRKPGAPPSQLPADDTDPYVPSQAAIERERWLTDLNRRSFQDRYIALRISAGPDIPLGTGRLFVILDGHGENALIGGIPAHIVDEIKSVFPAMFQHSLRTSRGNVREAIRESIAELNEHVRVLVNEEPNYLSQGSTLTLFYAPDGHKSAFRAKVGDSPFAEIAEGTVTVDYGHQHPEQANVITRAIGDFHNKDPFFRRDPDIQEVVLKPDAAYLLFSDGAVGPGRQSVDYLVDGIEQGLEGQELGDHIIAKKEEALAEVDRGKVQHDDLMIIKLTTDAEGRIEQVPAEALEPEEFPMPSSTTTAPPDVTAPAATTEPPPAAPSSTGTQPYPGAPADDRSEIRRAAGADSVDVFLIETGRTRDDLAREIAGEFERSRSVEKVITAYEAKARARRTDLENAAKAFFDILAREAASKAGEMSAAGRLEEWLNSEMDSWLEERVSAASARASAQFDLSGLLPLREIRSAIVRAVQPQQSFGPRFADIAKRRDALQVMESALAEKAGDAAFRQWFSAVFGRDLPASLHAPEAGSPEPVHYLIDLSVVQHASGDRTLGALNAELEALEKNGKVGLLAPKKLRGLQRFGALLARFAHLFYDRGTLNTQRIGREMFDTAGAFLILDNSPESRLGGMPETGQTVLTNSAAVLGTGMDPADFLRLMEIVRLSKTLWDLLGQSRGRPNVRIAGKAQLSALAEFMNRLMDTRAVRQAVMQSA